MPRTKRERAPAETLARVPSEILDHFALDRPMTAEEIDAATRRLKKALMERMLGAELSHHLGYPPGGTKPAALTNHRNGTTTKRVLTDDGALTVDIPRDREGSFAAADSQTRPPAGRLRRESPGVVCAGADRAGDAEIPPGDLRDRGLAGFD